MCVRRKLRGHPTNLQNVKKANEAIGSKLDELMNTNEQFKET